MNDNDDIILAGANDNIADDLILPFSLESSALRGRVVRLGPLAQDILSAHNYHPAVNQLLAQSMVAGLLFAAMIKYDGIFTLQIQGDGPVSLIVSDVTSTGEVRGYARVTGDIPDSASVTDLVGKGYIAFTVDQGNDADRYQGIVPLEGDDFAAICRGYFEHSEQIMTSFRLYAGEVDGQWRAGGVMLQKLPEEGGVGLQSVETLSDDWNRADILLQSVKDEELIDPNLSVQDILIRLFHEEGVRIYDPQLVTRGCRCTAEKLEGVLETLTPEDRAECAVDGKIVMTCEFCSRDWEFKA